MTMEAALSRWVVPATAVAWRKIGLEPGVGESARCDRWAAEGVAEQMATRWEPAAERGADAEPTGEVYMGSAGGNRRGAGVEDAD